MEDFNTPETPNNSEKSFATELGQEFAVSVAASAGAIVGLVAVGYVYSTIKEKRQARKDKKAQKHATK